METVEGLNESSAVTSRKLVEVLLSIGAGKIVENTLHKVVCFQLAKYRGYLDQITPDLEKFELKYNMSSEQFYNKFEAGELGDDGDFFEWSSIYENALLFNKRIAELGSLVNE